MFWFLVFSLIPLSLITGYFLRVYDSTIDNEIKERLSGNTREIESTFNDIRKRMRVSATTHVADPQVVYALSSGKGSLRSLALLRLKNQGVYRASYINLRGKYLVSIMESPQGIVEDSRLNGTSLVWEADFLNKILVTNQVQLVEYNKNGVDLVTVTRIRDRKNLIVGFLEEAYSISSYNLVRVAKRINAEVLLLDPKGRVIASSFERGLEGSNTSFGNLINQSEHTYARFKVHGKPYGFMVLPMSWGNDYFYMAVGVSKNASVTFQRRVITVLFILVGLLVILIIVSTWIVSGRLIVKPLHQLVEATQNLHQAEKPALITVNSDDEIGVLTSSFNEMSNRVHQAQTDLRFKINELQGAYLELKETQARLVHSAKMASLGQLVAGVAHELNNPIGFIYSNMAHLRDYTERILRLLKIAEEKPEQLAQKKTELEFDYIVKDLPRLIKSCEEGARRTRDIVVGLRNFSRLEEAKIKTINLKESIENTLSLLSGDIKNRITIDMDLDEAPEILCYPSQLNQVFMNILSNAVQAIEETGKITISSRSFKKTKQNFVAIIIKDTGRGIAPEHLEKIFDPFFTTKSVGQGTGLGLSISYGVVRKHGGDISVRSELDHGTEFTITLPVDGPQDVAI